MRLLRTILAGGIILALGVTPAVAQRRQVPDRGMFGIGGSIGAAVPTDDRGETGFLVAGNIEGDLTPRLSIRGQVGTTWEDLYPGQPFSGTINPLWIVGNVVYNWEGGKWHPYVTGGAGMYRYGYDERSATASFEGSDTGFGVNVGGGVEYFLRLHTTLTGEVLYHHVGEVVTALVPFDPARTWTFAIGIKRYL